MYSSADSSSRFQSTHPTRGCDEAPLTDKQKTFMISIHAPHEGVRQELDSNKDNPLNFNPRTPRGGATWTVRMIIRVPMYFNPRTPRGGATPKFLSEDIEKLFQSTHPTRGCEDTTYIPLFSFVISIHAPHEGVRRKQQHKRPNAGHFNPRTLRGGATMPYISTNSSFVFQSTHPTRGCDVHTDFCDVIQEYFNPRTPRGGAT